MSDNSEVQKPPEDRKGPGAGRGSHRVRLLLTLIAGLGLLAVLLSQVSLADVLRVAGRVDMALLAVALIGTFVATIIRTVRFGLFYSPGKQWVRLYGVFAVSRIVNMALPFRSGEIVTVNLLKKNRLGPSIAELAPTWILLRIGDLAGLAFVFISALSFTVVGDEYRMVPWVVLLLCAILLFAIWIAAKWQRTKGGWNIEGWIGRRLEAFSRGMEHAVALRSYLFAIGLGIALWIILVLVSTLAQMAFGSPLTPLQCVLAAALVLSYTVLPINPPLGVGAGEAVWTGVMVLFGVETPEAIAMALALRLFTIAVACGEGLLGMVLLTLRRT